LLQGSIKTATTMGGEPGKTALLIAYRFGLGYEKGKPI
jgi:hypothetical protein